MRTTTSSRTRVEGSRGSRSHGRRRFVRVSSFGFRVRALLFARDASGLVLILADRRRDRSRPRSRHSFSPPALFPVIVHHIKATPVIERILNAAGPSVDGSTARLARETAQAALSPRASIADAAPADDDAEGLVDPTTTTTRDADADGDEDAKEPPAWPLHLFARMEGCEYVYCGRLRALEHDPRKVPMKFTFRLLDAPLLRRSDDFLGARRSSRIPPGAKPGRLSSPRASSSPQFYTLNLPKPYNVPNPKWSAALVDMADADGSLGAFREGDRAATRAVEEEADAEGAEEKRRRR